MEQDRIHIKLARRTPEERQADETRRLDPFMRALKAIHTAATPETMNVEDLEKQRKGQELLGRLVAPMAGMSWEPFELDGMNCAWVRPHRGHDRRRAILYCHGGGYTSGNLGYSRILASKLANVTGWQVLSFEYRLAPEHPYPAAVEDAVKAWDYLMYQGYGPGRGGGRRLCRRKPGPGAHPPAQRGRTAAAPGPHSPLPVDRYDRQRQVLPGAGRHRPGAHGQLYSRRSGTPTPGTRTGPTSGSPLFGDLKDFPPTLIQAGSSELLLSDSIRLRDRLVQAAVPCRLEVWTDLWHVFQMFPMKKATEAMESIGRFLLETL